MGYQPSGPPPGSPPTHPPPSGTAVPSGDWERVGDSTYRFVVPGGWLYRYSSQYGGSTVFVPDPEVLYHAAVLAGGSHRS